MKTVAQVRRERLELLINGFNALKDFADFIGKSPAQVSQWRNASIDSKSGKPRSISDGAAREIESKFNKPLGWMDSQESTQQAVENKTRLNVVELPLLNTIASMGQGDYNEDELVIDVLRLSRSWIDNTLHPITNVQNLAFIHAIGDSMTPTFNDGDILLVDAGVKTVTSDNIYVLEAHNRLFIKRVRQRLSGMFEISSDNPSVKTVDVLNGSSEVKVKGRVLWVWNGKRV